MILRCKSSELDFEKGTFVVGIVNVTPDSFSNGGLFFETDKAISHAKELVESGADLLDIGGESTRPGAKFVSLDEELRRVIPVIEGLASQIRVPISIDTYKSEVAREALRAGAEIINDISALRFDPKMVRVAKSCDVPVVLMHMNGNPQTMQRDVHYDALIPEIIQFLRERIEVAEATGIDPQKIIVDPGIGFGKEVEHNLMIIRELSRFKILGKPIMIGTSRKSFIGKILGGTEREREEGTLATVAAAILNDANLVRVHEVKKTKRVIKMIDTLKNIPVGQASRLSDVKV